MKYQIQINFKQASYTFLKHCLQWQENKWISKYAQYIWTTTIEQPAMTSTLRHLWIPAACGNMYQQHPRLLNSTTIKSLCFKIQQNKHWKLPLTPILSKTTLFWCTQTSLWLATEILQTVVAKCTTFCH